MDFLKSIWNSETPSAVATGAFVAVTILFTSERVPLSFMMISGLLAVFLWIIKDYNKREWHSWYIDSLKEKEKERRKKHGLEETTDTERQ